MEVVQSKYHECNNASETKNKHKTNSASNNDKHSSEENSMLCLAPKAGLKVSINPSIDEDTFSTSPCVSYIDDKFSKKPQATSPQFRKRWRKAVLILQVTAIVGSIMLSIWSFAYSGDSNSASLFAFALDTVLGVIGNLIVIWRFRDARNSNLGPKREAFACLVYGSLFIASGTGSIALAIQKLTGKDKVKKPLVLVAVFELAFLFYLLLALASYYIAKKIQSPVMLACCIDMALNSASVFILGVSEVIVFYISPSLWYLDHIGAIFVGLLAVIVGSKIIAETVQCKNLDRLLADSEEILTVAKKH